ncbi:MAG TPA: hypothetical protein VNN10_16000 [Dehalococcoidia bacterium]|nr:hypothetical protein [Dehalococcoidia bacterium]
MIAWRYDSGARGRRTRYPSPARRGADKEVVLSLSGGVEEQRSGGLIGLLAQAHVHGLAEAHPCIMAARLAGGGTRAGAELLGYSESQMRRRWDQVKEVILVPLGLPPHDDALAMLWAALHRGCCSARMFELLKTDSRFTGRGLSTGWRSTDLYTRRKPKVCGLPGILHVRGIRP